jgi:hypothetical protein
MYIPSGLVVATGHARRVFLPGENENIWADILPRQAFSRKSLFSKLM